VETAEELRSALRREREGAAAIVMSAAVADYVPEKASSKLKKSGRDLLLKLTQGVDILAEIGADRKSEILVGFAAETEDVVENARAKLQRKNLDYIVANDVSAADVGIGAEENAVTILARDGSSRRVARAAKRQIAEAILDEIFGAPDEDDGR
jgi:phosphopantothenoylcysteine decarboxylase/phosphopantothenate--cysteine ligase